MFQGLRTVVYHVDDLDQAKRWYADALGFVVQGDTSDIVAVEVIDAQGKVIKHQGRFSSGSFVSLNFPGGVGTQSRLRVYLATPQSLVRIPFQLKGVTLP